jgi:hypothetical protein
MSNMEKLEEVIGRCITELVNATGLVGWAGPPMSVEGCEKTVARLRQHLAECLASGSSVPERELKDYLLTQCREDLESEREALTDLAVRIELESDYEAQSEALLATGDGEAIEAYARRLKEKAEWHMREVEDMEAKMKVFQPYWERDPTLTVGDMLRLIEQERSPKG